VKSGGVLLPYADLSFSVDSVDSVAIHSFGSLQLLFPLSAALRYILDMTTDAQMVLCSVPDETAAREIATALVSERLAACVNIVPGIISVYRWKDSVETGAELLLIIKTTAAVYARLQERIRALHPYELPEVIAVSIDRGLSDYLAWLRTSLD
jgi:periplasmic divalent cation tolerance protein